MLERDGTPLLSGEFRVENCGKQARVGGEQGSVLPGEGGKSERRKEKGGAVVLGLIGLMVELPISVVEVACKSVTVWTELAYFSCPPGREALA